MRNKMRNKSAKQQRQPSFPPHGTMKAWALYYAAQGLPVFAMHTDVEAWLGGARARRYGSTDPDTIAAWWEEWPHANIALPTGVATGIVAADVAPGAAQRAAAFYLPSATTTIRCPDGWMRYLYRMPTDGALRSKRIGDDVMLHGDGDYILLPPSVVV